MEAVSKSRQVVLWLSTSVMTLYLVLFQVQTVKCQSFRYNKNLMDTTMLPFCVELPGPLLSGKIIKIMGNFENSTDDTVSNKDYEVRNRVWDPPEHSFHSHRRTHGERVPFLPQPGRSWNSFRASSGATVKPNTPLNVILRSRCVNQETPFQLSVRFDNKTVTRNSFQNGNWEDEEIEGPFPFALGAQFLLLIEVQPDGYMVKGNGVPLWKFEHRFSFDDVKYLEVTGDRQIIQKIELVDPDIKGQQHSQLVYPVPLTKPVLHPTSPFYGQFTEEVQAGKAIRIKGYFSTKPERTSINLYADCFNGPIMLHLDIRFQFAIDFRVVLRNSYLNGNWKQEQRGGPFPFSVGEAFELIIQITPQSYNISVNNQQCWTYTHKLPYTEISCIRITKGMNIWKIEYTDFPEKEKSSSLMLTEEPDLSKSSSAASVYSIIVYTMNILSFFFILKAM